MERPRVPFVRSGESNVVNRALSEPLGLLLPIVSERNPPERAAEPRLFLYACSSVLQR